MIIFQRAKQSTRNIIHFVGAIDEYFIEKTLREIHQGDLVLHHNAWLTGQIQNRIN